MMSRARDTAPAMLATSDPDNLLLDDGDCLEDMLALLSDDCCSVATPLITNLSSAEDG